MANSSSYSPNNFNINAQDAIRNRVITDVFYPSSTVEPMVVMTVFKLNIVNENSVLNIIPYRLNGYAIKDVAHYNALSLIRIL